MPATISLTLVTQIAIAQLGAFASVLLLASGLHKLRDRARAVQAIEQLTGLAGSSARLAAPGVALLEVAAGGGLWIAQVRLDAALLAVLIWSGYFVFLAQALARGRSAFDCGCSFSGAHAGTGLFEVLRAASLALLGFVVAFSASVAPGSVSYEASPAAIATQLLAGLALFALYVALDAVMTLKPMRAGVVL